MKKSHLVRPGLGSLASVLLLFSLFPFTEICHAQESITTAGVAVTQNFDSLGSNATATLPAGWKMGADWSTGSTTTTRAAGTSGSGILTSSSAGGFYNFADGVTATSVDRSIGFLTASSYTSPRTIIYAFQNNTGSAVSSLTLAWDFEKFRSGSRAFDWTFFHGPTADASTSASVGDQSYAADANNTTISNPPAFISKSVSLSGLNIPDGGVYYLRWTYTGVGGSSNAQGLGIDNFSITLAAAVAGAPSITSPSTASAVAYQDSENIYQITASNDPLSFGATGLPVGLSVNSTTGIISGNVTTPGSYSVVVSATNAQGTGSATVNLTVVQNPGGPIITSNLTISTIVNNPISYQIEATNSPTSLSVGTLPIGLAFDASTGVISGTPTAAGIFNVPITATNALGSDTQTLVITVESVPSITSALSGSAYTGASFTYNITSSGVPSATSFSAADLPDGLSINESTGMISGTPTTVGTSNITLTATNAIGSGNATLALAVFDQAAQDAIPLNVVVNKYVNSSPDRVQLLVVGNGTAGSTVDLRGMILKDFSGSNGNDGGGKFLFTDHPLWSAVPAGALIALSAGTTQPEDIDPADFLLEVNLGNEDYFTNGGGSFDIATTDMLLLKSAGSGVLGVAGGIHALIGGSAGAQGTAYTGAKLRSTGTSGTNLGVMALDSNSQLTDFGAAGQTESTDAQGGVAASSLDFTGPNNASNANFINALRGIVDGTGSAAVLNAAPQSPFVGKNLFGRNLANQTVSVVFTPVSATTPITALGIEIPAAFGAPLEANVSINSTSSQNATLSVVGQNVTVGGLSLANPDTVTVSISGLATPDTSLSVTNNGTYPFIVSSQGGGGSLAPLASSPSASVLIPIANVRNADPTTFVPVLANQTVAVEGVCSVGRLGSGNTNSALQDATHGVTIFSQSAVAGPQTRGNRYAVVGSVAQFNGLVQLNLSDPSLFFDLGPEGDPTPVTITAAEFNSNGLAYQSRVVRIENLSYVSGNWITGQNVILQDSSNTQVTVRIQSGSTAGQPSYPVNLAGLGGQFDNTSPFNSGFQIQPRDQADAPVSAPVITSAPAASATEGEPFTYQITTTNNPPPTSYAADPLPAGLSINPTTGLVSGTPAQSGNFNILVSATNAGGATSQNLVLTVTGASAYDSWAAGFGLDPATDGAPTADPDNDSFSNLQEFAFGTNPTLPNGSLTSTAVADGNLTVSWSGPASGLAYRVQKTQNLSTTAFSDDPAIAIDSANGTMIFTVPITGTKTFYRVLAAPAP